MINRRTITGMICAGLLWLCGTGSAWATFKCVEADGAINFSDRPCPSDSQESKIRLTGEIEITERGSRPTHALSVDGEVRFKGDRYPIADVVAWWNPVREKAELYLYPFALNMTDTQAVLDGRLHEGKITRPTQAGEELHSGLHVDFRFSEGSSTRDRNSIDFAYVINSWQQPTLSSSLSREYAMPFVQELKVIRQQGREFVKANLRGPLNDYRFDLHFVTELLR